MKKLRDLLNEVGYIGLVSKRGFGKPSSNHIKEDEFSGPDPRRGSTIQGRGFERRGKEDEDWYGDDDQFDTDPGQEDTERITAIYNEGSGLLDDVGSQIEMFSEQLDENLEQLYDTSGDMTYKQQAGVIKKYFNNILRNIELTKKHLDAGF
jgi:hypothetical protein